MHHKPIVILDQILSVGGENINMLILEDYKGYRNVFMLKFQANFIFDCILNKYRLKNELDSHYVPHNSLLQLLSWLLVQLSI